MYRPRLVCTGIHQSCRQTARCATPPQSLEITGRYPRCTSHEGCTYELIKARSMRSALGALALRRVPCVSAERRPQILRLSPARVIELDHGVMDYDTMAWLPGTAQPLSVSARRPAAEPQPRGRGARRPPSPPPPTVSAGCRMISCCRAL